MKLTEAKTLARIVDILVEGDPIAIARLTAAMLQSNFTGFWWSVSPAGKITVEKKR